MSDHFGTLCIEGINVYKSTYVELLLNTGQSIMNESRLKVLFSEVCKRLNKLNPGFMNGFLKLRNSDQFDKKNSANLEILANNQETFGGKSVNVFGVTANF